MKKIILLSILGIAVSSFALMGFSPEKKDKVARITIPDNIAKIAEKSCFPCHTEPGNKMALMHLNLGKWNDLDGKKQIKKAGKMCSMVSKGAMPPKGFRTDNPDKIPTQAEVKEICDWAASVKK
ncbi:MAG: heme-binding domain-containing protein [Syntrophothermus sp.]